MDIAQKIEPQFCKEADKLHRKEWRLFAHQGHRKGKICFAKAAERDLTDEEIAGISAHELGHAVAQDFGLPAHSSTPPTSGPTPKKIQREADEVVRHFFRLPLWYNSRKLQETDPAFIL